MKDYFSLWTEHLKKRPQKTIPSAFEVIGEINQHVGPRADRVHVRAFLEPSNRLEVIDEVQSSHELNKLGYPDQFICGLLDILMTTEAMPITKMRITLRTVSYDSIDSSPRAFLEAGRDAGRKVCAFLEKKESK